MKIGFLLPTIFASKSVYPGRIFAPLSLAVDTVQGLRKNGHEVTVFSVPDFPAGEPVITANFEYFKNNTPIHKLRNELLIDRKVRTDEVLKRNFELAVTCKAYEFAQAQKIDIIHSYHDFVFISHYFQDLFKTKTVYTIHDPLPPEGVFEYLEYTKFASHNYISISNFQRQSKLKLNFADTIYHGVNLSDFEFSDKSSDYLLFMGRLVPEKGLHHAIATALSTNMQLEIGTQFPDHNHEDVYFTSQIKPYLDNPLIGEPGMVSGKDKVLLYKQAQALLFPIGWEEPFGMVMIEALACGTPVIAFNRGSVAEVIQDGVTGFIIDPDNNDRSGKGKWIIKKQGVEGLVEAVKRIGEIDRNVCRKYVEDHFTVDLMVKKYEKTYKQILNSKL